MIFDRPPQTGLSAGGDYTFHYFVRQLAKRLVDDLDLDRRAIFSTGMSNGGDMSFLLAVHGTNDQVTRWSGDMQNREGWGADLGVEAVMDLWVRGLALEISETSELPGGQDNEVTGVRLRRWSTSADATEFRLYERTGGRHVWPKDLGDKDRSTAEEIWSFFHAQLRDSSSG